jgi:hypothetical protein
MKLPAIMSLLCLAISSATGQPVRAEEINLKDGSKIVGHMTQVTADKIEVETSYGKIQLNRKDVVSINFPENSPPKALGGVIGGAPNNSLDLPNVNLDLPKIDETLNGTQYVNRTGKFSLTLPPDWVLREDLRHSPLTLAALGSKDKSRYAIVLREEYPGSLDSYKEMVMLNARTTLCGLEKLAESNATIDGKPAMLVYYRGALKSSTVPAEYLAAIIASGHSYTKITVWCVEPLFHDMQPSFESILNSYHEIRAVAPPPDKR